MIKVAKNLTNMLRFKQSVDAETPDGTWEKFVNSPEMENINGKIVDEYRKKYLDLLAQDMAFAQDNELDLTFYEDAFGEKGMNPDEARRRLLAAIDPKDPQLPYYKALKYKDPSSANKDTSFPKQGK